MHSSGIENFISGKVELDCLELVLIEVPQKELFASSIGQRAARLALIVKWINQNGTVGFGECSCRPDPFYSHEFVEGAVKIIQDFIFPLLTKKASYKQVLETLNKIRGWNFTKAAIEFAMNDVISRETGRGILESSGIKRLKKVPVGISMGLFESRQQLIAKLESINTLQYQRLKFKISDRYDNHEILDTIQELSHENISFDANGAFKKSSFHLLQHFASMGHTIEQPFAPGDHYLLDEYLKKFKPFKICLDEDIESYGNLVGALHHADEVNIKPGRVGGLYNTLRMIDFCQKKGISAWIGGMFETGIGRAQNLQVASMLPNAKAHDLSPSSRYFSQDVLVKPIEMHDGYIDEGFFSQVEIDEGAMEKMTVEKIVLQK